MPPWNLSHTCFHLRSLVFPYRRILSDLVEETEAHIFVRLFLLFFFFLFLLRLSWSRITPSSRSTTSCCPTSTSARWDRCEFRSTLRDQLRKDVSLCRANRSLQASTYFLQVFALKLRDQFVQALVVCVNSYGGKDILDILGRRRSVATEAEKEVCCEMLHDVCSTSVLVFKFGRIPRSEDSYFVITYVFEQENQSI